jgi:PAS domain S-box-containing protein
VPDSETRPRGRQLRVAIAFGVGLILLAGTAIHGGLQSRAATEARGRVTEGYEVLVRTLEFENAVTLMEARHRAFLVQGDAEFERRREASHGEARAALATLAGQLPADGSQDTALRQVEAALAQRHATMQEHSARLRSEGIEAARRAFDAFGSGSLDPIRQLLGELRAQQRRALNTRHERAAERAGRFEQVLVWATSLALLLLGLAAWALHREARHNETIGRRLDRVGAMQRAMLEDGGVMIVAARPDGVIRLFNRAAADALGYRADEVIGRHTPALFHDEEELAARAAQLSAELGEPVSGFGVLTALARRARVDRQEWTFVRKDGSRFPVELAVTAVRDPTGQDHGYVGMALDLSARREAEQAVARLNASLRAKAEALTEANAELESFSYSVSHDLRAPLRHIDGYARILEEEAGDRLTSELQHYLGRIAHSARRMGSLIDDLLAFSRLARSALQRQPVEMAELAREALRELPGPGAAVEIGSLPQVPGDPALLRQVWCNLLSNAIKYSTPRGADARVRVDGRVEDGQAVFEVTDNGVGFDMRYRDRLFGVFQRLHPQDEFEGTGIGLAIVQRIVRRHGGRVDASATPGQGATFRFELPLAEAG